jgi:hypothetical protein
MRKKERSRGEGRKNTKERKGKKRREKGAFFCQ